jgi:alpha-1,2-mannosyltransferase
MHLQVYPTSHPLAYILNDLAAFLPSSFAMCTTMAAFSYAMASPSKQDKHRTIFATLLFATGGILGWPFSLALAIPFVFEELFILGGDRIAPEVRSRWRLDRWKRLFAAGAVASLLFVGCLSLSSHLR